MIMFRTEAFSGSGVRKADEVMAFEIFELGNTDILETLADGILKNRPITLAVMSTIKAIETGDKDLPAADDDVALKFCSELLREVFEETGVKVNYALWLTSKESISEFFGRDMADGLDYDAYETGPVVLSEDDGDGGVLFGYTDMPKPLLANKEEITITNARWG